MTTTITKNANTTETNNPDVGNHEEILNRFLALIDEGNIEINTGFVGDEDTGVFTHQVMRITCGDYVTVSQPEPLAVPVIAANREQIEASGETIN